MGSRTRQKQFEDNSSEPELTPALETGVRHWLGWPQTSDAGPIDPNGPMFKVEPEELLDILDEVLCDDGIKESISPWKIWKVKDPKKMSTREYVDAHTVHESWGRDEFPLRGALWPR